MAALRITLRDKLEFIESLLIPSFDLDYELVTSKQRKEWVQHRADLTGWNASISSELILRYGTVASLNEAKREMGKCLLEKTAKVGGDSSEQSGEMRMLEQGAKTISVAHNVLAAVSIEFKEVKPRSINGQPLFEREEAARQIVDVLLSNKGLRETVMLDYSFGIGKTSVIYKCRSIVRNRIDNPAGFDMLEKAVYIYVRCDKCSELSKLDSVSTKSTDICDFVAMRLVAAALSISAGAHLHLQMDKGFHEFALSLGRCCGGQKFIVHFDDVGVFEGYGDEIAFCMLYRIWRLGSKLKDFDHYFAMSGRSRLLHIVGRRTRASEDLSFFSSRDIAVRISLPPLTDTGVEALVMNQFLQWESIRVQTWAFIKMLCHGVPRAVQAIASELLLLGGDKVFAMQLDELHERLESKVLLYCGTSEVSAKDTLSLTCLELAWSGMGIPEDATMGGLPIIGVIARLGIYYERGSSGLLKLIVPPYSMVPSIRSLISIAEYDNPGSRLEIGFRRVLILRFRVYRPTSWTLACLPFLDALNVPFPQVTFENCFPFPKISTQVSEAPEALEDFMLKVHAGEHDCERKAFPASSLPALSAMMREGQYYQLLPLSSSADAKIRLSRNVLLDLQFKNFVKPFTKSQLKEEILKSQIDGWVVYLVVICSAGHSLSQTGSDWFSEEDRINCIVLSKESVELYFGKRAIESISS